MLQPHKNVKRNMTRLPNTPATDAIERMAFMLKAAVFVNANTTWDMKQEMKNGKWNSP